MKETTRLKVTGSSGWPLPEVVSAKQELKFEKKIFAPTFVLKNHSVNQDSGEKLVT